MTILSRRFVGGVVAAACCLAVLAPTVAFAQSPSEGALAMTCPDAADIDLRSDFVRLLKRPREIRPSAGAITSSELYQHARHADLAYTLSDVFDEGGDPRAAFNAPGLELSALIFGAPGLGSERNEKARARSKALYGFVADEPESGLRFIVFRGTVDPMEWLRNLQIRQRVWPKAATDEDPDTDSDAIAIAETDPETNADIDADAGDALSADTATATSMNTEVREPRLAVSRVHAGFLAIFQSLRVEDEAGERPLSDAIVDLVGDRDAVFVGHSLGAALATLAGVDAGLRAKSVPSRIRVTTLASPRVGNPAFAALAGGLARIDRVCNLVDIVPAVPPSTFRILYQHVGTPFRVSSFDWPFLTNDLEETVDQAKCWHSQHAYAASLNPDHDDRSPNQCFRDQPGGE